MSKFDDRKTDLRSRAKGDEMRMQRESEMAKSDVRSESYTKEELMIEFSSLARLHELNTRLLSKTEFRPLLEEVLDATIALLDADFGNVQLYEPSTGALKIVAQRGFQQDFVDYFDSVHEGTAACGTALERKKRVVVEDVLTDPLFAPHLKIVDAAGFRAVQSTPMFSRNGEPLGILSTHFRRPHRPEERDLRITDLYVRQAADMIERKRAEDALHASEERFRRYFELGLIGMAITSGTKGCLEVNDELCRILGYERDELLQKTWSEITHPDDLAADVAQFKRVLGGEIDGYTLDKRWIRKDGQIINTIMAARCARRNDGSVDYFVGVLLDISERKRVEASLLRSEANLAEGQRISHTGSWGWNTSSGELYCSQELLRIFGLDAGPVQPTLESFMRMIHRDERESIREKFEHAVETRADYKAEYRIVRADGALRHIQNLGHPVFDEASELVEYVGTAIDITERKRSEEKLVESERRFRQLAESIPHHVWSFRPDGTVGYWNQQLMDYTGLTDEDLRQGGWKAIHPDDVERVRAAWDVAFAQGTSYEEEQRVRGRDGRYRRFICRAVPVHDEVGQPLEWYATNSEIEEHRQAEEVRTQLLHRLFNAQEEERRRIAREMHDQFGQELSALTLGLSALRRESCAQGDLESRFEALEEIARQLNEDADFLVWELRPTALDDLGLLAALSNYVNRWSEHFGVRAELHAGGMEKERLSNEIETTLYRIMQEALTNIAKHAEAGNVSILLERRNDQVSFIVEDDGVGFDGERAFGDVKGGFGLLGMRERATLVGGTLGIESAPGAGATVIIRIPLFNVPAGDDQNG